jgi:hypothetical protein
MLKPTSVVSREGLQGLADTVEKESKEGGHAGDAWNDDDIERRKSNSER